MTLSWFFWRRESNAKPQAAADKLHLDEDKKPAKPAVLAHVLQEPHTRSPPWRALRKHLLAGYDTTTMRGNHLLQSATLGDFIL